MIRDRAGFALLAVMLVLALLGVVIAEFALSMRLEASAARTYKHGTTATHLAEAAVQQAIREILADSTIQGLDENGDLVFYQQDPGVQGPPRPLPALPRRRVPLGPGDFSYRITDEESRININLSTPDRLDGLLGALDVERRQRDIINDSVLDWKDADDQHRLNGAESDDTYLKLPVPYRARNGNLQDVAELLQIRGVTPELYRGSGDRPGLAQLVTVFGRNNVNINTAPVPVLRAVGLSDAEVSGVVDTRKHGPYPAVPGQFGTRGMGVGSQAFRIEAEARVAGEPLARLVVVVMRGAPQNLTALPGALPPEPVTVLSWRPGGDR